ncbi:glycosyl hydrolase family 76 protein [Anopheles sinensis]|uniref:Glycosyl hydrolase family 76 protein n=1 Tax=Anopheles sinensis TaxID=74873 RepID=A0A084WL73_ANOSI|nr:glycosyl hydrolase family 76 protein [Anopheles sinensis]
MVRIAFDLLVQRPPGLRLRKLTSLLYVAYRLHSIISRGRARALTHNQIGTLWRSARGADRFPREAARLNVIEPSSRAIVLVGMPGRGAKAFIRLQKERVAANGVRETRRSRANS